MRSASAPRGRPVVERRGEPSAALPDLIIWGISAYDRLKYYLALLQSAAEYARTPTGQPLLLTAEREACGITDAALDATVTNSHAEPDGTISIPGAGVILQQVSTTLRQMLDPIANAALVRADLRERAELYKRRVEQLIAHSPACVDDRLTPAVVAELAKRSGNGHDTLQQLATDLHWELIQLQASLALESVDGAETYAVTEADRRLIRAFMKGVHEVAPLQVEGRGLRTIAARDGDRLSIRNELESADVHVVAVQVHDLEVTILHTDRHRSRARFFRELLEPYEFAWDDRPAEREGVSDTHGGRLTSASLDELERLLARIGSRVVFLLGWNRARQRLSQLVRSTDATALLKWAADNNIGHRGFLRAGDAQLVYAALDRAAPARLRHGERLDDLLGRDAARLFLMAVLRITSWGLRSGQSTRLMEDEIEAELMPYIERSDRVMLGGVADHAMVVMAAAEWVERTLAQLRDGGSIPDEASITSLVKTWRSRAEEIVGRTTRAIDRSNDLQPFRRLVGEGARALKALERTTFALTLGRGHLSPAAGSRIESLCALVTGGVREYVRLLEQARELTRVMDRHVLDRFVVTVDRLAALEDHCDDEERGVIEQLMRSGDFRELHLMSAIAEQLDVAVDAVSRAGLGVRDYVLRLAPGL